MNYDNLDRLTSKIVPARSGLSSTHTRNVYFAYDLFGNLTDARFDSLSGEGVIVNYDGLGRPASETSTMNGATRTVSSSYDTAGNRISITYPDSQAFTYTFDGFGRPDQIRDAASNALVDFNFDTQGRVDRMDRYGTSKNQYMSFDITSRLTGLSVGASSTSSTNAATFGYNPASQISSSTKSNDSFAWNAHQNAARNYWTNGRNQYTAAGAVSFAYDGNGNLTSDGTNIYVYDVENRLVSKAGGGSSVTLRYDPLGRLYEVNGSQTGIIRFAYDGDALIAEYNSSGAMLQRYVHGPSAGLDDPLVSYAGSSALIGNARMLYADERGSIVYSTNSSGGAAAINSYDVYGIPGTGNTGRFQYTGQIWIPELGAYHYKARVYSPTLGRFLQTDPIGYGDGMNMYRYVGNDPINANDPTGQLKNPATGTRLRNHVPAGLFGYFGRFDSEGQREIALVASWGSCSSDCPKAPGQWQRKDSGNGWSPWVKVGAAPSFGQLLNGAYGMSQNGDPSSLENLTKDLLVSGRAQSLKVQSTKGDGKHEWIVQMLASRDAIWYELQLIFGGQVTQERSGVWVMHITPDTRVIYRSSTRGGGRTLEFRNPYLNNKGFLKFRFSY